MGLSLSCNCIEPVVVLLKQIRGRTDGLCAPESVRAVGTWIGRQRRTVSIYPDRFPITIGSMSETTCAERGVNRTALDGGTPSRGRAWQTASATQMRAKPRWRWTDRRISVFLSPTEKSCEILCAFLLLRFTLFCGMIVQDYRGYTPEN